ncbi:LOW QUALITY PROTEIN: hypothetical protein ACHAWO_013275 [Cyclotella atomus]|uniref:Uncharacterized protein n=1 Tax=Cyclotella atomus TaxID=382360 RepID=A0ABD3QJT3_9STRA
MLVSPLCFSKSIKGGISSTLSLAFSYCAFSSASSICNACLGSTAPNTSGRRRSVLLLAPTVMLALYFQYSVAPAILGDKSSWWNLFRSTPGLGSHVLKSWTRGCEVYLDTGESTKQSLSYQECVGNSGVYRPTFFAFLFFTVASIASYVKPSSNRMVWPAKIQYLPPFWYLFMSNQPMFTGIFLHLSRVGAMIFVVIQQVILIDLAYNWNDSWVGKADACDRLEWGEWRKVAESNNCSLCYFLPLVVRGHRFALSHLWRASNNTIISMTFIGIIGVTILQLSGTEGGLLTSSIISLYVVYLGYSSVSMNPLGACNPQLARGNDTWDMILGLVLTSISLAWTGWSWTAEERVTTSGHDPLLDLDDPFLDYHDENELPDEYHHSEIWKLNTILTLISCWIAMSLTGWGSIADTIEEEGVSTHTAANPEIGKLNMVMIALSQWMALLLYAWTLLAPRLFLDRDFS